MNNNRQLFLASFFTLIAAGVGFAIRGAILADWATDFGFTKQTLGDILSPPTSKIVGPSPMERPPDMGVIL